MTQSHDRVLIVGAGPVGLCLALTLTQAGITSTILEQLSDANFLDQVPRAGTTSFTAPTQPLCVRSKTMPLGSLYLHS